MSSSTAQWIRALAPWVAVLYVTYRFVTTRRKTRRSMPEIDRRLLDVAKQAEHLRQKDPAAAELMLEQLGRERIAHLANLRARVPSDRAAAQELHDIAARGLDGNRLAMEYLREQTPPDPTLPVIVEGINSDGAAFQADIDLIRQHWPDIS